MNVLCFNGHHGCLKVVKLVLRLYHECFSNHHRCSKVVKIGLTKGSSRMVKLVFGLYHMSFKDDKGEFQSGGASAWSSP